MSEKICAECGHRVCGCGVCKADQLSGGCGRCGACFAYAMQALDAEANRAAEMEAQAQREKARADAAEQSIDVYEQRIREIADDVFGVQDAHAASVVLLDAIGRQCHRERIERDAAIAARDEAVAAFERSGAKGLVAMAQRDAAERARDEVGIQLAAAQAEIARMRPVVEAARHIDRAIEDAGGAHVETWSPVPLLRSFRAVHDALRALDTVSGDALAPRITAALEASGIDTSNVKVAQ